MGEVIAVLSGKGGTGKTTVCAGVASALALSGRKVLCIDCDMGLRNLDISLGMSQEDVLSFTDVCNGGYDLEQATRHNTFSDLYFLTAPVRERADNVDKTAFRTLLEQAREKFDFVFLDAPAGLHAGVTLTYADADRVILVTGADYASVRAAAQIGQVLERAGKTDIRLVVNWYEPKTLSAMGWTVDDIMDQAGLPLLGVVPEDRNVILATANRTPLLRFTRWGAAKACKRIAQRLEGHTVDIKL